MAEEAAFGQVAVRWVFADELAGAVIDAPQGPPEPLQHAAVLDAIHRRICVLPTRFGTVLSDEAEIRSLLKAHRRDLLERLLQIEVEEGRIRRGVRDEARTLDLDLLIFADRCIDEEGLIVPHPRMQERGFVLEPLCELAPQWVHPISGRTVAELAARVRDPAAVRLWGGS